MLAVVEVRAAFNIVLLAEFAAWAVNIVLRFKEDIITKVLIEIALCYSLVRLADRA